MSGDEPRDWPLRAALLAVAGATIGLALHFILDSKTRWSLLDETGRLALAALLTVGGITYGFVVERTEQRLSLLFAGLAAVVVAGVIYWNGAAPGGWDSSDIWRMICALLTVAIAAPLFQAWRGARGGAGGIPYVAAHNNAWTDVVLWFAAWAFTGVAWLLVFLLSALFGLIGIRALARLIEQHWFILTLTGTAFGGAVGLLRDRERVLGTLQRVVTTVLSVLAPVLAVGLLVFLAALPVTGLAPLWGATKSTTPILLGCIIGALLLANAVIGDAPEDETPRRVLRWAAMGLGVAMLPLALIAAVSTGLRIDQYGLTPDRLWAVVFTAIACAYGLAYLVALVRGRTAWGVPVRAANLTLALGLCAVALVLSTPLAAFGALSTRDQLARLESGRTPLARFDWGALRFDFGREGKAGVERLARSGTTPAIRNAAATALKSQSRWSARQEVEVTRRIETLESRLIIVPKRVPLPPVLRTRIAQYNQCDTGPRCALLYTRGDTEAFLVPPTTSFGDNVIRIEVPPPQPLPTRRPVDATPPAPPASDAERIRAAKRAAAVAAGAVEIRKVERRQVFVGGEPVGDTFP